MAYKFRAGQFVKFTYRDISETPVSRFKEVLILHPNWQGKVHAIDMKRLTPAEAEVVHQIMDPANRGKPHKIPLVADVLRRMNPVEDIKNPVSFYSRFVKVFLRDKDAYRTYYAQKMSAVTIIRQTNVKGGVINPKPLFHNVDTKPQSPKPTQTTTAPTPTKAKVSGQPAKPAASAKAAGAPKRAEPAKKPMSRLDMIRAMAKKKGK